MEHVQNRSTYDMHRVDGAVAVWAWALRALQVAQRASQQWQMREGQQQRRYDTFAFDPAVCLAVVDRHECVSIRQ